MHQLQRISWAITLLGVATIAAAVLFDLDAVVLLAGLLLAWAGIVKIVITLVWTKIAGMGSDDHRPTPSP